MIIEEIRANAPKGATHWCKWWAEISDEEYILYFKYEDGKVYDVFHGEWKKSLYRIDQLKPL
ncbi:hypothetical protein Brutus_00084 [Acinetobacter phage Brutus]|nr:hypothetical protein Brutus_00084 [Acinetobacter phage Brutus]